MPGPLAQRKSESQIQLDAVTLGELELEVRSSGRLYVTVVL
jgi:hypothetical protein